MAEEATLSLTHFEQAYLLDALIEYVETHEGFYKIQGKNFHQIPQQYKEQLIGLKKIVNRLAPYTFRYLDTFNK